MSDELWLKELAQAKRDQDADSWNRLDERWDRLSAGTLSPEEDAKIKALAGESTEAAEAYEAFRPLGPEFQARVVQAIQKQGFAPTAEPPPANVIPFRQRNLIRIVWSTAAAVAAALLFFVVRGPSYPPLPAYVMAPISGDQVFRGGTASATGRPVVSDGSLLTLEAGTEQAVKGRVEAYAYAGRNAEWVSLGRPTSSDSGSVRLQGVLGREIRLSPGVWTIWLVVGRPGKIPAEEDIQTELRAGRTHDDWRAVSTEIRVEEHQASP